MNDFWIPGPISDLLDTAISTEALAPSSVYALAATHGDDWMALVLNIVEIASNPIHSNRDTHRKVALAADAAHAWIREYN